MKVLWNNKGRTTLSLLLFAFCFLLLALCYLMYPKGAISGPYTDSAHGNTTYGVNRSSLSSFNYSKGNCAHCHEQHASIGGSEPTPTGGPDKYALFYKNHSSQTDNFCFKCHTDLNSLQGTGALYNYSYSYRAGACPSSSCTENDILELFSYTTSPNSSHNLNDILNFINGKWGYTSSDSNPCVACHNPHRVQGDPANSTLPKSSSTRGWPVSRPSQHSKDNSSWGLWGDDSTEKMSYYTSSYQAPYRYGGVAYGYEPDGSTTTDGSNLTDFVTFCTDCHNSTNTIYSTTLGRNLKTIDWETGDKHGKNTADGYICTKPPYPYAATCTNSGLGKVLSCLDCHEPHGAPNAFLIRKEVNGGLLSGTVSTGTSDYGYLCGQCHLDDSNFGGTANRWEGVHHCKGDYPYAQSSCSNCHSSGGGGVVCKGGPGTTPPIPCSNCHYHGSSVTNATVLPSTRRTF